MMKKIFGMAAMSALVFGMFACSDGEDGINGQDGKDGADGVACTVKALKDESGFKVLCDGDSVGVLKNGTAGKDGKAGADGKDGEDGEDGADGSGKAGSDGKAGADGEDGTGCTAKSVKDGFAVICGKDTVGTIKNGDAGEAGDGCTLTDGDNGVITVACGTKSVNIFKAVCNDGKTSYDPETHLCYRYWDSEAKKAVYTAIPRCKDWSVAYPSYYDEDEDGSSWSYDPREFFCNNNVLIPKCILHEAEDDTKDSVVEYDAKNEYCDTDNNTISEKVPCGDDDNGKKFKRKPTEYCYRNAGDPKTKMRTAELLTCGSGNSLKTYSPVEKFCAKDNGVLGDMAICAAPADADPYNIDILYMASEELDTRKGQVCDTRDWNIYNTVTLDNGKTWMTDNLRYVIPEEKGSGATADLDSGSFCYDNDCTKYNGVRAYIWSAMIDSAALASAATPMYCGYGEEACTFDKPVQGVCPDGWHLPATGSSDFTGEYDFGVKGIYSNEGPFVYQKNLTSADPLERKEMGYGTYFDYIWSAEDLSKNHAADIGLRYMRPYSTNQKYYGLPVRCIKDYPEEVTP